MQTGMLQPSGPSSHFWINFGSVWARYTASGGAAKRLVTIRCLSPSVLNVILLITFLLISVFRFRPGLHPACRSSSPVRCAALPTTGASLQYRSLRDGEGVSCLRFGER